MGAFENALCLLLQMNLKFSNTMQFPGGSHLEIKCSKCSQ